MSRERSSERIKDAMVLIFAIVAIIWLLGHWRTPDAKAYENCNTVSGGDAQTRIENIEACREANALEKISEKGDDNEASDR